MGMTTISVGGTNITFSDSSPNYEEINSALEKMSGLVDSGFAGLTPLPGPGIELVFDEKSFHVLTGTTQPLDNRSGLTSTYFDGKDFDTPRVIFLRPHPEDPRYLTQAFLEEITHVYFDAANETRASRRVRFSAPSFVRASARGNSKPGSDRPGRRDVGRAVRLVR